MREVKDGRESHARLSTIHSDLSVHLANTYHSEYQKCE